MGHFRRFRVLPLAILGWFAAFGPHPATAAGAVQAIEHAPESPMVIGLKLQDDASHSRLSIEFSDAVDFRTFMLTEPNRLVIDLPDVVWHPGAAPAPSGKGFVKNYRFGLFRKGNSRIVVELTKPVRIEHAEMQPPKDGAGFRLNLDLAPASISEFQAHSGWPRPPATAGASKPIPVTQALHDDKHTIVIDAGHGGMDPGTHGATGIVEKDLALNVARILRDRLLQSGRYRVKLTRDADVFIPLRDRVEIARAAHGDLFLSLHADSNERREIRGASVYTLSPGASDLETASLAEKENLSGAAPGVETAETNPLADSILTDLGQREIANLSARFAETLLSALPSVTGVHAPLPHRSANFAVLKAPDIPSLLLELGYLTNPDDESKMLTESWKSRVAGAIASAIDRHFSQAPALEPARTEVADVPLSGHIGGVRTHPSPPQTGQEFVR